MLSTISRVWQRACRHGACSIAEVAKERISSPAGRAMMAFIWIALVYVIVAFADITAASFVAMTDELRGAKIDFNPGGAVAAASIFYLLLAVVMGMTKKLFNPPLWLLTLIFVPATFGVVWMGTRFSTLFSFDATTWALIICAYLWIIAASLGITRSVSIAAGTPRKRRLKPFCHKSSDLSAGIPCRSPFSCRVIPGIPIVVLLRTTLAYGETVGAVSRLAVSGFATKIANAHPARAKLVLE